MLALSRALVVDAKVILADELSMGLAPVIVDEIFEVVEQFRAEGRSLLIVEQFVARALGVADYVYILHKGRVVFVGETRAVPTRACLRAVRRVDGLTVRPTTGGVRP